ASRYTLSRTTLELPGITPSSRVTFSPILEFTANTYFNLI
ncbi:hypothetical protein CISIN_1g0202553mg, partial [Citrus sinensis]